MNFEARSEFTCVRAAGLYTLQRGGLAIDTAWIVCLIKSILHFQKMDTQSVQRWAKRILITAAVAAALPLLSYAATRCIEKILTRMRDKPIIREAPCAGTGCNDHMNRVLVHAEGHIHHSGAACLPDTILHSKVSVEYCTAFISQMVWRHAGPQSGFLEPATVALTLRLLKWRILAVVAKLPGAVRAAPKGHRLQLLWTAVRLAEWARRAVIWEHIVWPIIMHSK